MYKFDGVPAHIVLTHPRGNARSNKPYRGTRESTKCMIKNELEHSDPKDAVDKVFEERGGMVSAQRAGELPRGRTNIRMQSQKEKLTASTGTQRYDSNDCKDMLFVVMQQCKNAEKGECFVQEVTCAPEPMAVLCTKQ